MRAKHSKSSRSGFPSAERGGDACAAGNIVSLCCRRGARAGGEAPLAIQGIPAGAQRVPAATAQTTQVSLLSHVTTPAGLHPVERGRGREGTTKMWITVGLCGTT